MREVILLLLLVPIGCGFLLSSTLSLNQELTEAKDQLARMQADMQMLQAQYQALVEEKSRLAEQVSGLTGENAGLRARVETLEAERLVLTGQIDALQGKLAFIEAVNSIPAWLGSSARRVAALLILPVVPLSFGAVYVMTHQKATNRPAVRTKRRGQRQNTFQAELTREEFHILAQLRRSQRAE